MRPAKSQLRRSLLSAEKSIDVTVVLLCALRLGGLGFVVWGFGFGIWGLGFGVQG